MDNMFIEILIRIGMASLGIFLIWKMLKVFMWIDSKIRDWNYKLSKDDINNSRKQFDLPLGSWYGNGLSLCGEYSRRGGDVNYYCITFFTLPILPLQCVYSVKSGSQSSSWKKTRTTYSVYGSTNWRILEIISMYFRTLYSLAYAFMFFFLIEIVLSGNSYYRIIYHFYMYGDWHVI